jgi:hypothetical protein
MGLWGPDGRAIGKEVISRLLQFAMQLWKLRGLYRMLQMLYRLRRRQSVA